MYTIGMDRISTIRKNINNVLSSFVTSDALDSHLRAYYTSLRKWARMTVTENLYSALSGTPSAHREKRWVDLSIRLRATKSKFPLVLNLLLENSSKPNLIPSLYAA